MKLLFHGTGKTDPALIYESDKGWKINYANDKSLWGRGNYFAQDAVYSGRYAYATGKAKTHKLILAAVIVGDGLMCEENQSLREPPIKSGKKRYDSVIGIRHGTYIWAVYDNARAYPTYVIEYAPKGTG